MCFLRSEWGCVTRVLSSFAMLLVRLCAFPFVVGSVRFPLWERFCGMRVLSSFAILLVCLCVSVLMILSSFAMFLVWLCVFLFMGCLCACWRLPQPCCVFMVFGCLPFVWFCGFMGIRLMGLSCVLCSLCVLVVRCSGSLLKCS